MSEYRVVLKVDGKEIELEGVDCEFPTLLFSYDGSGKGTKSINKQLKGSATIRYCVIGAGPVGHPQEVFKKICKEKDWEYVSGEGHPIGDCWIFEVKYYNTSSFGYLPSYIKVLGNREE